MFGQRAVPSELLRIFSMFKLWEEEGGGRMWQSEIIICMIQILFVERSLDIHEIPAAQGTA